MFAHTKRHRPPLPGRELGLTLPGSAAALILAALFLCILLAATVHSAPGLFHTASVMRDIGNGGAKLVAPLSQVSGSEVKLDETDDKNHKGLANKAVTSVAAEEAGIPNQASKLNSWSAQLAKEIERAKLRDPATLSTQNPGPKIALEKETAKTSGQSKHQQTRGDDLAMTLEKISVDQKKTGNTMEAPEKSKEDPTLWSARQLEVREAFLHAWKGYTTHAWGKVARIFSL